MTGWAGFPLTSCGNDGLVGPFEYYDMASSTLQELSMRYLLCLLIASMALSLWVAPGRPQTTPKPASRINNLKVLSSAIDDVTTSENFLKSFVKPGMSDE